MVLGLGGLAHDLRYGARSLARKPGLTAAAVATLALGIGATSSLLSVVRGVLLRPLAYPDSEAIVQIWESRERIGRERGHVSPADFFDWQAGNRVFDSMTAFSDRAFNVSAGQAAGSVGEPLRVEGAFVSGEFFRVLRQSPAFGRVLEPGDDEPGAPKVAVVGGVLWGRLFATDSFALGSTIRVDGVPREIVGIVPASLQIPRPSTALWIPLALDAEERSVRALHYLQVLARLRPGGTLSSAREEMNRIAARLEREHSVNSGHGVRLSSLMDEIVGSVRPALRLLMGAVGLVLAIVCANVANLLLVQAAGRARELHLRFALGAGRGRLVRQLLTESLLLALAGALAGILVAVWSIDFLRGLSATTLPRASEIRLDAFVLSLTLLAAVATGVVFGIAPALHTWKLPALDRAGSRSLDSGGRRLRRALVIGQVALALVLAFGAALLTRSLGRLLEVEPGFLRERLLFAELSLPEARYPTPGLRERFFQELRSRLSAAPGVISAATVTTAPLRGPSGSRYFDIEDQPPTPPGHGRNAAFNLVSPGYFETMGIALLRGRDFTDAEGSGTEPVAIVNRAMARRFWPDEDPLGDRIQVGGDPWRTIVGVVADVRQRGLDAAPEPEMYWPQLQSPYPLATLVLRTSEEPRSVIPAVRASVSSLDRELPLGRMASGEDLIGATLAPRRLPLALLGLFAAISVALAAVGLGGVLSYGVTLRSREIGLRMALGAERRDVLQMVLGEGLLLAACGVAIGAVASLSMSRFMAHQLYGVAPGDPESFISVALLLTLASLLAGYFPARRATRVDPIAALRQE